MAADQAPSHVRVFQCVAALLQRTLGWPDGRSAPARVTRCDHLAFTPNGDGDDEDVTVALSPQGEAVFRAWLCQRGFDPMVST
jgi:hypothetical protein